MISLRFRIDRIESHGRCFRSFGCLFRGTRWRHRHSGLRLRRRKPKDRVSSLDVVDDQGNCASQGGREQNNGQIIPSYIPNLIVHSCKECGCAYDTIKSTVLIA